MRAQLTIEKGEAVPNRYELNANEAITLGRSRNNNIVLRDEHASRQHAQLRWENDAWLIQDLGTLNGTYVNGERIAEPRALEHGQIIGIADMRLRFCDLDAAPPPRPGAFDSTGTLFLADDLAELYQFMITAAGESDPQNMVARMLETIAERTEANLVGFMNLDPDHPVPKQIVGRAASMDNDLSRHLTQRAKETGRRVWFGSGTDSASCDSVASFADALCIPLPAEGGPLGALHVYSHERPLTPREVQFCEVVAGFAASNLSRLRLLRILSAENSRLRGHSDLPTELVGSSPAMEQLRQTIARAAAVDATVLIQGESGVGKELVANALHRASARRSGPFVVANCGAFTESLIDSQLFGHVKGAFTNALTNHAGFFQQADDGTLFLDEIGDMPLEAQVKLLRAIEGHPFRPVGGTSDIRADVRVVAATNKELEKAVTAKEFRQDLFFRLRVIVIRVPPLREHTDDIPALVEHFLQKAGGRRKECSPAAMKGLREYHWPGNVRQLRGVLDHAMAMGEGPVIQPKDLGFVELPAPDQPNTLALGDVEAWAIRKALDQVDWNVTQAAHILGIGRDTVGKKMQQYGIARGT
jgi:two-component system, NtrC family, response regulator HydG